MSLRAEGRARTSAATLIARVIALVMVSAALHPQTALSALFACTESQGVTIITDRPTQLSQCRPLNDYPIPEASDPPRRMTPAPAPTPQSQPLSPEAPHPAQEQTLTPPLSASIPLERIGSLFVVTIVVNETRSARLILDTGASHTILSRAIARDLGLWSQRPSASVTMHTAGGAVQADLMQIDSIRIGGAHVRQSIAAIHDLPDAPPDIEGLLGLSVLGHFEVTLDTARNRLLLGAARP
jgi:clan AA aspartic protease (TIGR02281 family)